MNTLDLKEGLSKISRLIDIYESLRVEKPQNEEQSIMLKNDIRAARKLLLTEIIETKKALKDGY